MPEYWLGVTFGFDNNRNGVIIIPDSNPPRWEPTSRGKILFYFIGISGDGKFSSACSWTAILVLTFIFKLILIVSYLTLGSN